MNIYKEDGKEYISTKDAAKLWGVKPKTVGEYCLNGKIENAIKRSGKWYISVDETKPLNKSKIIQFIKLLDQLEKHSEYDIDLEEYGISKSNLEIIHKNISIRKLDYVPKLKKISYEKIIDLIVNCAKAINATTQCFMLIKNLISLMRGIN